MFGKIQLPPPRRQVTMPNATRLQRLRANINRLRNFRFPSRDPFAMGSSHNPRQERTNLPGWEEARYVTGRNKRGGRNVTIIPRNTPQKKPTPYIIPELYDWAHNDEQQMANSKLSFPENTFTANTLEEAKRKRAQANAKPYARPTTSKDWANLDIPLYSLFKGRVPINTVSSELGMGKAIPTQDNAWYSPQTNLRFPGGEPSRVLAKAIQARLAGKPLPPGVKLHDFDLYDYAAKGKFPGISYVDSEGKREYIAPREMIKMDRSGEIRPSFDFNTNFGAGRNRYPADWREPVSIVDRAKGELAYENLMNRWEQEQEAARRKAERENPNRSLPLDLQNIMPSVMPGQTSFTPPVPTGYGRTQALTPAIQEATAAAKQNSLRNAWEWARNHAEPNSVYNTSLAKLLSNLSNVRTGW